MSIFFCAEGNIGSAEFKPVRTDDGDKMVLNLSVKFSADKLNKSTGEWEDKGFWASVEYWGKRAEKLSTLVGIGSRILVVGNQHVDQYESTVEETLGQVLTRPKIRASTIALSPMGIKSIEREPRKNEVPGSGVDERHLEPAFDDDVPY